VLQKSRKHEASRGVRRRPAAFKRIIFDHRHSRGSEAAKQNCFVWQIFDVVLKLQILYALHNEPLSCVMKLWEGVCFYCVGFMQNKPLVKVFEIEEAVLRKAAKFLLGASVLAKVQIVYLFISLHRLWSMKSVAPAPSRLRESFNGIPNKQVKLEEMDKATAQNCNRTKIHHPFSSHSYVS